MNADIYEPPGDTPTPPVCDVAQEAERSVLGALLLSCEPTWPPEMELLAPGHFGSPLHARVFRAMQQLQDAGEPIDTVTTWGGLRNASDPPEEGWATYLGELVAATPTAAGLGHYATLVLRESRRRDYLLVMSRAIDQARKPHADADAIATEATIQLGQLTDGQEVARPVTMREMVRGELKDLDERRNNPRPIGHETGFPDLDHLICGLVPGHLTIVAGRPAMGKSSFARNILVRLGLRGIRCLLFTFEMGEQEIGQAIIASEARVNLQRIRSARLSSEEYGRVTNAMAALHNCQLDVVDRAGMGIAEIRSAARAHVSRHPVGAVAVDYIQLAEGTGQNREQEIASISRGLKGLAKELHAPVLGLSQLNRSLESRSDKRPQLSDLRESGAIEQDADEVIFLYRDEYYHRDTKEPGIAEACVSKNRNGPTGMVRLKWFGEYTRFESYSSQEQEQR